MSRVAISKQHTGSIDYFLLGRMPLDCSFVGMLKGREMTDQLGARKRESFSSIEVLSVVAMTLVLVLVAVPEPYVNRNRTSPALHAASGGGASVNDPGSWDTLPSAGGENASTVGDATQGSPFEARTVGKREFCADMPGVVRFSTNGPSCRNGTILSNAQRKREQQAKP
jgi:hypothetical protein